MKKIKKIIWRYFINGYLVGVVFLSIVSRDMPMVKILKVSFLAGLIFWPVVEVVKKDIIEIKKELKNADIVGKIMFIIALILFILKAYIKISRMR